MFRQEETSDSSGVSTPGPGSGSASAGPYTPATQKKNGDADSLNKVADFVYITRMTAFNRSIAF